MTRKKNVNIYDVAKKAGVSIATISNYLNNKGYLSEKTAKRIGKIIKDINYIPSEIARSLTIKSTKNIGVLSRDITNPYHSEIVRGIRNYIGQHNLKYHISLVDLNNKDKDSNEYINQFLENRIAGIITTSDKINFKNINYLKKINVPIIFISRYIDKPSYNLDFIILDNFKGAYMITNHLIKCGHKNIGFISFHLDTKTLIDRENGFKQALRDSNIDFNDELKITIKDHTIEEGGRAAKIVSSLKNRPTAVFCINDFIAIGFIDWCFKNNINVPEDISVTGFDDIKLSSLKLIELTTIKVPIEYMAGKAAEILFKKMTSDDKETYNIIVEPELIIRKSVKYITSGNK
jgi:DNA-binding LacI/PurR family transcriptional regulator